MEMNQDKKLERPVWITEKGQVDEIFFCNAFQRKHHIIYTEGSFFGPEGRISQEDDLRQMIYEELRPHIRSGAAARVESILNTMSMEARQNCLDEDLSSMLMTIPVANGNYQLDKGFSTMKHLTRYRLPVNYNPDAPKPEKWLKFLSELLHEEDIPTLQEYLGYCLIPSTHAQKMLIITGKGGEGKSRIGVVMKGLLGCNMKVGSVAKVEKSPFARADLQHCLLMVDDDLKMEALDQTNYLKSIITAEIPMDLEKKGIQSYQGQLYVRFLAFGNSSLQALHDRSYGFFRRQIILQAKERPADRKDDPFLSYSLLQELEGILLWAIEGLERLHVQSFRFTQSRRARENMLESMLRGNNVLEFLRSSGYIRFDPEESASSRALYETYRDWCSDNALNPLSCGSFWSFLGQNQQTFHLTPSRSVPIGGGRYARGFKGISVISRLGI